MGCAQRSAMMAIESLRQSSIALPENCCPSQHLHAYQEAAHYPEVVPLAGSQVALRDMWWRTELFALHVAQMASYHLWPQLLATLAACLPRSSVSLLLAQRHLLMPALRVRSLNMERLVQDVAQGR